MLAVFLLYLLQAADLTQADRLYAQGEFQKAATIYTQLLRAEPNNPLLLAKLGSSEYQAGASEQAVKHLRAALELQPSLHPARLALGGALLDSGQPADAVQHLQKAAAAMPQNLDALRLLGRAHMEADQFFEAESTLKAVLKRDAKDWKSWTWLGTLLYNNNYYAPALEALRTALKLEPANPRARILEAASLTQLAKHEKAGQIYKELLSHPQLRHQPELLLGYTQFLVDTNRPAEALAPIEAAVAAQPDEPKLHFWRARVLLLLEKPEAAIESARKAVALAPGRPNGRNLLLKIARRLNLEKEAAEQARWLEEYDRTRKPVKR